MLIPHGSSKNLIAGFEFLLNEEKTDHIMDQQRAVAKLLSLVSFLSLPVGKFIATLLSLTT